MEKYDVSYRLPDGKASLVAQHVPQVRPDLPWLPEGVPPENLRRIAMICAMEEDPPGLVPWMIVRTHDYSVEQGKHHLHWQKGVFLNHAPHGEALLEKRGREFHIYTQATYPEYFMTVLQETLQKLIKDNWPGMEGRYRLSVPCSTLNCKGRFNIQALRQFMSNGVREYPCQECFQSHLITKLLLGFEDRSIEVQLREINERLAGLDSRIADYFMGLMRAIADEAKDGPRLFTLRSISEGLIRRQLELQLWCEAEGCQHPIMEPEKGTYPLKISQEWVVKVAPYANFALGLLKTVAPVAGPAINAFFGPDTTKLWGLDRQLDLAKSILSQLPQEIQAVEHGLSPRGMLRENERAGLLALHSMLKELDPHQERIGLHRIPTYTGDYRWLCQKHYEAAQSKIPDVIEG
jgi:internalin A